MPRGLWGMASVATVAVAVAVLAAADPGASTRGAALLAPGALLDQSYVSTGVDDPCGESGWAPEDETGYAAQTFTAGVTGFLTNVRVPLERGEGSALIPRFVLAVVPVDASGTPVVSNSLASQAVTWRPPARRRYPLVDVLFTAPARVVAGKQYGLVLSAPAMGDAGGRVVVWEAALGSSAPLEGGPPCESGTYPSGHAFTKGAEPLGADADFYFQTFVVPDRMTAKLVVHTTGRGDVASRPAGISCGRTCTHRFLAGPVALTAKGRFLRWTGACHGAKATCRLDARGGATTTVTAVFDKR